FCLHSRYIDYPCKGSGFQNRKFECNNTFTEHLLQLIENLEKVCIFFIYFTYKKELWNFFIGYLLPCFFSTDLNTVFRTCKNNGSICYTNPLPQFTDKIEITGSIDNVYLVPFPFQWRQ